MAKRKNYPGNIERRGSSFRIRFMVKGRTHSFTLDGVTRAEAEAFASERYLEVRRGATLGLPGNKKVSQLLNAFVEIRLPGLSPRTQETYGHQILAFRTFFEKRMGDPLIPEIRPGDIESFLHWRKGRKVNGAPRPEPLAARSLAKDRAVLHTIFEFAETMDWTRVNPVRKTKVPKADPREPVILSDEQYEDLLAASQEDPMLHLYVLVLGEAGLRADSEALWLRWEDVDLEGGLLTVEGVRKGRRTKSGRSRKVPMTHRLRAAMREHFAAYRLGSPSKWVFHHLRSTRQFQRGDRVKDIRRRFIRAVERAGLPPDFRRHDLRHRRVTTWLAAGQPIHLVQKAMGHSDIRTTLGYEHLVATDLLQLVEEPSSATKAAKG